ncbi:6-phospho-beta-glucosidase [Thermotoga profunda]|uniref:6-phospho-beta-glucosidase n=1 Tax=Thermotoga profunda TaxID=1508420 RepID=UPI0005972A45|nr:6-phospho-beta-glucosidase [Thermotoga profunda]
MKIAVIGAGSTYTPELIKGFMEISKDVNIDEVVLHDIEKSSEKLQILYEFTQKLVKGGFKIKKTFEIIEAVQGADYVIFQFRVGGLLARQNDERIPLSHGLIGQETTGIGGFACALRTFPVVRKYVEIVDKYSKATIINFTNPSGHVTEFVLNYLGFDRFIGLCNIPINLLKMISQIIGCKMEDIFLKYYGLNHLTFLEKVYVKDQDITEKLMQNMKLHLANIPSQEFPEWVLDALRLYPNAYLRYYLSEKTMLEKLKKEGIRAEKVLSIESKLLELYKKIDQIPLELSQRGGSMYSTAAAYLIRDLSLSSGTMHIVNTKNNGAVNNLPDDYVLEIPCLVKAGRVFPVTLGRADEFAVGLTHTIKMYERLTIQAFLEKSKQKAIKAMLLHPLGPGIEDAQQLLEEILKSNRDFIDLG